MDQAEIIKDSGFAGHQGIHDVKLLFLDLMGLAVHREAGNKEIPEHVPASVIFLKIVFQQYFDILLSESISKAGIVVL